MATQSVVVGFEENGPLLKGSEKRKIKGAVSVVCELEILEEDLAKMSDEPQEIEEARRHIETSLAHLNQNTQLLDPNWKGWRLRSFAVNDSTP